MISVVVARWAVANSSTHKLARGLITVLAVSAADMKYVWLSMTWTKPVRSPESLDDKIWRQYKWWQISFIGILEKQLYTVRNISTMKSVTLYLKFAVFLKLVRFLFRIDTGSWLQKNKHEHPRLIWVYFVIFSCRSRPSFGSWSATPLFSWTSCKPVKWDDVVEFSSSSSRT